MTVFLNSLFTETGKEAFEDFVPSEDGELENNYKPEIAIVNAPTIILTLEAGVGNKTLPMLLFYLGFQSTVNDWSTKTVRLRKICNEKSFRYFYPYSVFRWGSSAL